MGIFPVCVQFAVIGVFMAVNSVSSHSSNYPHIRTNALQRSKQFPQFSPNNVLKQPYSESFKPSQSTIAEIRKDERKPVEVKVEEEPYGYGWPHKPAEKEVDNTLDELTGVIGPALFLIPFVLKTLPFAIPAIPLSYILTRYAPGTVPEIITRITELYTQLTELLQNGRDGIA